MFVGVALVRAGDYSMRDPVQVGHREFVQLLGVEGRAVEVVTLSDESTGLRAFLVDNFLTAEECAAIRAAAPAGLKKSGVNRDFPVLKDLRSKKGVNRLFRLADSNRDGNLNEEELAIFLRSETDVVDHNHTEFIEEELGVVAGTLAAAAERKVTREEFAAVDWSAYFEKLSKLRPQRFARDSRQAWLDYKDHPVLSELLSKVAAVTGLPHKLVKRKAEPLQLLQYAPHGSHYSCHHDSSMDDVEEFRFMTFFLFLNDVIDGGETVLFGTDMNGTKSTRRSWGEHEWGDLEGQCQSTRSCPASPGEQLREPFSTAAVVRPKLGRAIFWYNMEVDSQGRGRRFVWSSIHGGCPTRLQEKWAANIWLRAGPMATGSEEL